MEGSILAAPVAPPWAEFPVGPSAKQAQSAFFEARSRLGRVFGAATLGVPTEIVLSATAKIGSLLAGCLPDNLPSCHGPAPIGNFIVDILVGSILQGLKAHARADLSPVEQELRSTHKVWAALHPHLSQSDIAEEAAGTRAELRNACEISGDGRPNG